LLTLGAGDVILVKVANHPELSGQTTITVNGDVMLPLTNESIPAKGLTTDELSDKITEIMAKYIQEPQVTVDLLESKSKFFYVIDEIGSTPYPINRPNLTLLDALFIADWGPQRAVGRVLVIKPSPLHPIVKKIDAYEMVYRGNLKNNILIGNGDVIYIPKTIVGRLNDYISETFAPLNSLSSGTGTASSQVTNIRKLKGQKMQPISEDTTASD
jgi:polysaccharide export outer membrane protein